jgi:hypothetical protein
VKIRNQNIRTKIEKKRQTYILIRRERKVGRKETTTGNKPLNTRRKKINLNYFDKPTNHVNLIKKMTKIICKKT